MIFSIWFLLFFSVLECSRINLISKRLKNYQQNHFSTKTSKQPNAPKSKKTSSVTTVTASKTKFKPKPKIFDFHYDFSLSSMFTGVALSVIGYYYFENKELNRKLIKRQLLLGEIDYTVDFGDFFNDEKLFTDAVNRKNSRLCLLLLKNGARPRILNDFGDNLLVKLIDNEMIEVLDFLLTFSTDLRVAVDFMDESTGKTPLLASIKAKKYLVAKTLLEMGAKPLIPLTAKYPARSIKDFLKEIDNDDESEESKELLKIFHKLFNDI